MLNITWYWSYAVNQFVKYFRETFHRHALEYLEPSHSEKKSARENDVFLRKRLNIIDFFEGL